MSSDLFVQTLGSLREWIPGFLPALAIRGSLVLGAAGGGTALMRRGSAAARHLVWTAAVAGVLALPLLSSLPGWRVLPDWSGTFRLPSMLGEFAGSGPPSITNGSAPVAPPRSPAPSSAAALAALPLAMMAVWPVGVVLMLLVPVLGRWRLHRVERLCTPVEDADWLALLRQSRASLGMRRDVRILFGPPDSMPMAWGIFRPRLLLPADAMTWSGQRRSLVLLHELAHIERRDALAQLLAQVARAIQWFNPLAWLAVSRMQVERERTCDDMVLRLGTPAPVYARELLAVAAGCRFRRALPAMAMATSARLEGRLRSILDEHGNRARTTPRHALAATLALALVTLPVACARSKAASPSAATATHDKSGTPFDGPFYRTTARLLGVGQAVCAYAANHDQHLPPDLGAAFAAMQSSGIYKTDGAGHSLTDADRAALFLTVKDEQTTHIPDYPTPDWINAHTSFTYLGSADILWSDVPDWDQTVIVHSALLDTSDGARPGFLCYGLCMLDAHVEPIVKADAERRIAESKERLAAARKK